MRAMGRIGDAAGAHAFSGGVYHHGGNVAFDLKQVLVTGGAGFIGSHLVEALVAAGCRVTVMDNLSTGSLANLAAVKERISFFKGDIRDPAQLAHVARGCDVIFHLAAEVSVTRTVDDPIDSAMVNAMGTLFVLEAARQNRVRRVVLASTCAVYGEGGHRPNTESMPPAPMSPYAVQKLSGEYYARLYDGLYGVETVCLRYFNVYGPRQDPSSPYSGVISIFMTRAVSGRRPVIYGDGGQYRDFVFVEDVVRANLLAARVPRPAGRTINVGTGRYLSITGLWESVSRLAGLDLAPEYHPPRPGDIIASQADMDRAAAVLDFRPEYAPETGLAITFDWYRHRCRQASRDDG